MTRYLKTTFVLIVTLIATVNVHAASKTLQSFRAQAPADTLFYWDAELSQFPYINQSGSFQSSQIERMLESLNTIGDEFSPQATYLLSYLLKDFADTIAEDPGALSSHYNLSNKQEVALYLDGLSPILHLAVKSPNAIKAIVIEAADSSQSIYQKENWLGKEVFTWSFDDEVGFAIVFDKKSVTFGLYSQQDSNERTYRRLGLIAEKSSVQTEKLQDNIQSEYGFNSALMGYFSISELAKAIMMNEKSTATQDLVLLQAEISKPADSICRLEWQALADSTPRLVFGYNNISRKKGLLKTSATMNLEMTNARVRSELEKLNGHLSAFATQDSGQILSLAYGFDTDAMSSVATALWTNFINTEYQCDKLKESQQVMQEMNPATVALFSAMAQSLQGFGFSLYDLQINDLDTLDISVDALLTLSGPKPAMLATLLANAPQLKGLMLPEDGSAMPLKSLNLPPALTPSASLKGDHLAIFIGEQSRKQANALVNEDLNKDGMLGLYVDYNRIYNLVSTSIFSGSSLTESMDVETCIEAYIGLQPMAMTDASLSMISRIDGQGLSTDLKMDMKLPSKKSRGGFDTSSYQLQQMSSGCVWESVGKETINSDGTGLYQYIDDVEQCVTWQSEYNWNKTGTRLTFDEFNTQSRISCDDSFEDEQTVQFECIITDENINGFSCLFTYDEEAPDLYRYIRN